METTTEQLKARSARIRADIDGLLEQSSLQHWNPVQENFVFFGPTGQWGQLEPEAQRRQSKILGEYDHYFAVLSVLLRGLPSDGAKQLAESDEVIREIVDQGASTWIKTIAEARQKADAALTTQESLLDRLYDAGDGRDVYVPDTNALLYNVDLDGWSFPDSPTFELVLVPSVLVELDGLKVDHRNEGIRDRAEGLIRRIKGYRGRGLINEGVPLRASVSTIRAIGGEPRMAESLPWLDRDNRDDRFIASVIEVMRAHPRSAVTIVTRDINLQTKADVASLPFAEPPEPRMRATPE